MNDDVTQWTYQLILRVCSLWEYDFDPDVATYRRMFESVGEVLAQQLRTDLYDDLQRRGPHESDEPFINWAYQEICWSLASCPFPADPLIIGLGEQLAKKLNANPLDCRCTYNLDEDVKHVRQMISSAN